MTQDSASPQPRRKKKKTPLQRRVAHSLEYAGARLFAGIAGRLPRSWHTPLAGAVAPLVRRLSAARLAVLRENLYTAFGEIPAEPLNKMLRLCYRNAARASLEFAWLRHASPEAVLKLARYREDDLQRLALLGQARGLIVGGAHLGNWEWLGAFYALKLRRVGVIYKPMHNPWTNALVESLRGRFGSIGFSTRNSPKDMLRHLANGGTLGILSDQDARREGAFVPFFGKSASTALGMASLARRLSVPLVFTCATRDAEGNFHINISDSITPAPVQGREAREAEDIRVMTLYHEWLEAQIRKNPEQYFWWHKRWKTRPKP